MRGVRNLGEIQGSNFSSIAGFGFSRRVEKKSREARQTEGAANEFADPSGGGRMNAYYCDAKSGDWMWSVS